MVGKIVKGIAGFYYVHVPEKGVYECKAKGVFRNRNQKPLVGDLVTIEIIDASTSIGNIIQLQPRTNQLVRPAVANVDQAVVVFAVAEPEPNLHLLDYFLVRMEMENVPTIICFNKIDLISEETINDYSDMYRQCGYQTITASAQNDIGAEALLQIMENKTTVLAGPSGVGKSSIMNLLYPCAEVSTGEISNYLGYHSNHLATF